MDERTTGSRSADLDLAWLDLNTATKSDLAAIPWIGDQLALDLIARRPFMNMDDVRRVPGVTEDIIDMLLRGGAMVGDPTP